MVDFEKGSPEWDIGMILTRHKATSHGDGMTCRRVEVLQATTPHQRGGVRMSAHERFALVDEEPCTCGVGVLDIERTSTKEQLWKLRQDTAESSLT